MAFKMAVSKETIEGKETIPAGIYDVRLVSFKPKFSDPARTNKPKSLNLNARMEIINHPEYAGRFIYEGLNAKAGWVQTDFCHAFGIPMETDGDSYWIPGIWDSKPDFDQENADSYAYSGPLVGQVAKVELAVDSFNGRDNNKVRRYFCAIDQCETKFPQISHSTDLLKKS
jgi:hypothetical protein